MFLKQTAETREHTGSYYAASARHPTSYPVLETDISADVVVVGGGFSGVATALELAERGYKVVLLEANRIGWGASGRNGGQIISGLGHDPGNFLHEVGEDGIRVINQMGDTPLTIDRFPFFIGRKSDKKDDDLDEPIEGPAALILEDRRPFRLSRRHLAIDREEDQFVVRDYRSFHGTIVNGIPLAVGGGGLKIQLDPGENEIIAGNFIYLRMKFHVL